MRVAELVAPGRFEIAAREPQEPAPGEVRVRVTSVGLCGSDLHYYAEGSIGDIECVYPMVLGHEPAGIVDRPGAGVAGLSPGDKVFLEPALYCYHCEFCLTGRHNVCSNIRFMSMPQDPGFLRDFVVVPATNVLPVPEGLSLDQATIVEPLAVVLHSMQFVALRPAETAAVFGAGPIGLLTIIALKLSGASRVWSVEPVAHRRELALAVGADAALDPSQVDPSAEILNETHHRGVDVAIDCAAKPGTLDHCFRATRNAGRVVMTGIPSETRVPIEFHVMRRKELALYNVRRSNHESHAAFELLREHPARFSRILTHTRPLEKVGEAFSIVANYSDGVGKMIVKLA
jgi:L-iditol 2-dehydrogenase